jgi:AraC-like DNA-binding protein
MINIIKIILPETFKTLLCDVKFLSSRKNNRKLFNYFILLFQYNLSLLFSELLDYIPYKIVNSQDYLNNQTKAHRMKRIVEYIDKNYQGKIYLSDLAKMESVTDTHISHFFTENFHITFQQYLMKLRCEKARSLLLTTNLPLIDISVTLLQRYI